MSYVQPLLFVKFLFSILTVQLWRVWLLLAAAIFAIGCVLWLTTADSSFWSMVGQSYAKALNIGTIEDSTFSGWKMVIEFLLETFYIITIGIVVASCLNAIGASYKEEGP